jgi:hypothetical protein
VVRRTALEWIEHCQRAARESGLSIEAYIEQEALKERQKEQARILKQKRKEERAAEALRKFWSRIGVPHDE